MKKGSVTQSDAISKGGQSAVCGYRASNQPPGPTQSGKFDTFFLRYFLQVELEILIKKTRKIFRFELVPDLGLD